MSIPAPSESASARPTQWDGPASSYPARDRIALIALITIPALLVALVLAVLFGAWWIGALALGLWLVKTIAEARWTDVMMLRRLGAEALEPHSRPRLQNLVAGIARDLGVDPPRLYVVQSGGSNALVATGARSGILVVTETLLDDFTRTELEAVVAHCLARLHSDDFVYSNLAARWSDLGAGLAPRVGSAADVRAAALTRYPPALAAAIRKCDPKVKRYAPLWFVAAAPSHDPSEERAALVADL